MTRKRLTPDQCATIERVWLATANASEAAREAGCSHQSALRVIVRRGLDSAGQLYAQALAKAERLHLALVRKARRRVSKALDQAGTDSEAVSELTRAANDSLRAVAATRAAHLKISGLSAPDRHDVTSGGAPLAAVVLLPALDDDAPADGALAPEPGPADTLPRQPRE